jgi:hypothetical protein
MSETTLRYVCVVHIGSSEDQGAIRSELLNMDEVDKIEKQLQEGDFFCFNNDQRGTQTWINPAHVAVMVVERWKDGGGP